MIVYVHKISVALTKYYIRNVFLVKLDFCTKHDKHENTVRYTCRVKGNVKVVLNPLRSMFTPLLCHRQNIFEGMNEEDEISKRNLKVYAVSCEILYRTRIRLRHLETLLTHHSIRGFQQTTALYMYKTH